MTEEATWYSKNRQHALEMANTYANQHKEERKAYWKQWYEKNKEKLLERRKAYAKKNKPKIYENYRKKYYKKNYEKTKQQKQEKESIPSPSFSSLPPHRPEFTFTRSTEPVLVTWD